MNRADMYLKQLHGLQAWLRAQGDEEGADQADDLAEHLSRNHEAVDDLAEPPWTGGPDFEADVEPDIRCRPEVGVVYMNRDGEPILTVDMLDGGDVAVVHMGDVVRWVERRGAPDPEQARGLAAKEASDPFNIDPYPGYGEKTIDDLEDAQRERAEAQWGEARAAGSGSDPRAEGLTDEQHRTEDLTEDPA
jgi:hypothetical protein